jgi:FtsH-binding integral membrane protein
MKHLAAKVSLGVVVLAALAAWYIFRGGPEQETNQRLSQVTSYFALLIVFLFGVIVLAEMVAGRIDLSQLLGEHGSGASMSRFQLLIFTLVIGLSFVLVVANTNKMPEISSQVLLLLGISGSTYAVSKGIQATTPEGLARKGDPAAPEKKGGG